MSRWRTLRASSTPLSCDTRATLPGPATASSFMTGDRPEAVAIASLARWPRRARLPRHPPVSSPPPVDSAFTTGDGVRLKIAEVRGSRKRHRPPHPVSLGKSRHHSPLLSEVLRLILFVKVSLEHQ